MDWAKVQVAEHARGMADNQRTLDRSNQTDQRLRDLDFRIAEANAERALGVKLRPAAEAKEDDTRILIDSPMTITNNYPQAATKTTNGTPPASTLPASPPPTQPPSTWSKTWPWVLAGAAGLAGAGAPAAISALRPDPTPVVPAVEMPKYDVEKWTPPK
jgi:hypothetical protein